MIMADVQFAQEPVKAVLPHESRIRLHIGYNSSQPFYYSGLTGTSIQLHFNPRPKHTNGPRGHAAASYCVHELHHLFRLRACPDRSIETLGERLATEAGAIAAEDELAKKCDIILPYDYKVSPSTLRDLLSEYKGRLARPYKNCTTFFEKFGGYLVAAHIARVLVAETGASAVDMLPIPAEKILKPTFGAVSLGQHYRPHPGRNVGSLEQSCPYHP
jgi:uncharacterized protein YjaZ